MQRLVPTAVTLGNLSGSAADLDDSPDSPDANWCARPTPSIPAWIADLAVGEWAAVPTSNAITDVDYATAASAVVNAWGCIAVDPATGDVYMFGGGHNDYSGNELYKLALNQSSPAYSRVNDPSTPTANVNYYGDGTPVSRHTYNALWISEGRLICGGGAARYNDASGVSYTDIFDLTAETWDTQVDAGGNLFLCGDHATGNVYAVAPAPYYAYSFLQLSGTDTWTELGQSSTFEFKDYAAAAFDSSRSRIYRIGGTGGTEDVQYWQVGTGAADPSLTGTAATQFDGASTYPGCDYDAANDCILLKDATGSTVYKLNCSTLECTTYSTSGDATGNATNGVNGRFRYVPTLKGFIYIPSWGNAYFLRTVA